ncbi:MAG TPA: hypothetical protein VNC82_18445 [Candidatus Limnocylindria bacterium]|nr:hypothetical protein [Candidatus Limnocylindria bacterium]
MHTRMSVPRAGTLTRGVSERRQKAGTGQIQSASATTGTRKGH